MIDTSDQKTIQQHILAEKPKCILYTYRPSYSKSLQEIALKQMHNVVEMYTTSVAQTNGTHISEHTHIPRCPITVFFYLPVIKIWIHSF